jgi:NADPH2:quinone reductase
MKESTMTGSHARAVRLDHYGDRDVLHLSEIPMPAPGVGEVLLEVRAAGINPGEASIRRGLLHDRFPATFPSGQGSDVAGVVVGVGDGPGDGLGDGLGDGPAEFAVGDEVLGYCWTRSSHATHVVVPATQLIAKPAGLSWEVAGGLYVVACTAWAAVRAVDPQPRETVVVSAAAGGVGTIVTQLLGLRGAHVLGIASPASAAWLRGHGATPVSYGPDLARDVRAAAPDGVDAFIDLFGPEYLQLAVDLGVRPARIETIISRDEALRIGAHTAGSVDGSSREVLTEMADLVARGQIDIPIAAVFTLDEVRDAFAVLERRRTRGKIVLVP